MFCIYIAEYIINKTGDTEYGRVIRGYRSKTGGDLIDGVASEWYTVLTCCLTQGNFVLLYKRGYPEGVLS